MPWTHCGQEVRDDVSCPTCGLSKAEWSVAWERTRAFQLSRSREATVALKFRLRTQAGALVAGERFEATLSDGKVVGGETTRYGLGKATTAVPGWGQVRLPGRAPAAVEGASADPEAPGAVIRARVGELTELRLLTLANPRWSQERARCGEEVELLVDAPGLDEGAAVTFRIVEADLDGDDDPVEALEGVVSGGVARARWTYRHVADEDDAPRPEERGGYTWPEFAFVATAAGAEVRAPLLRWSDVYELQLVDEEGRPIARRGVRYRAVLADGAVREGELICDGSLRLEDVPPGELEVTLAWEEA